MRQLRMPVLAILAIVHLFLTIQGASAQWEQLDKLINDEPGCGQTFGREVSSDGDFTVIGNYNFAFVYDVTHGTQLHILISNDIATNDFFGHSVSVSGNIAVIGAWGNDDDGLFSGSAYLFDLISGNQLHKLTAEDAASNDKFGQDVAISGDIAIVGAWGNGDNGSFSGSAYLFDVASGLQLSKLSPSDATGSQHFGYSVDIRGDFAIVGANSDDEMGSSAGAAYLFDISDPRKPVELHKLTAEDAAITARFGHDVSIKNNLALVGANSDDDAASNAGAAYLFDVETGQQLYKLTAEDASSGDALGKNVALGDGFALIGADGHDYIDYNSGAAYIFDTATGVQIQKLIPNDPEAQDLFGAATAINMEYVLVGALFDDDAGPEDPDCNSGSVYLYTYTNLCPWDLDNSDYVGASDLLALFAQWGTAGTADFDESGIVDTSDLLILFANWGPCP